MKILLFLFIFIPVSKLWAQTSTRGFEELWQQLYQKSLKQKAVVLEKEMNQTSLNRAERHWLPRAFVGGQWMSTNDPGQVFFNHLGQRSIEQSDFMTANLNEPDRAGFRNIGLGIDLPLYEGGFKTNQTQMYQSLVQASEIELKAKRSEEYAELARHYGNLLINIQNEKLLQELKIKLQRIISSYQVGAQSNPVGYSGLLGLKGIDNRIEGILAQNEMNTANDRQWIDRKTEMTGPWLPQLSEDIIKFLTTNLSLADRGLHSSMIMAQEMKLKSLNDMKEMEKARYLPKVGLFAQNNIYDGSRATESSQTFGLYLQWEIFNPDSYGRVDEAGAKSLAEKAKLETFKQEEKIAYDQLLESKAALEKNLKLLKDSDRLLQEQSLNAMKLFQSGMMNALQLSEVINRRVDLVENKIKVETQYLDVWSRLHQLNN